MLTSTIRFSSSPNALQAYAKNVGTAAREFVAALLAIKPANDDNAPLNGVKVTPASDELSLYRLYRLASRSDSYESVSPELANELRLIAARG